MTERPCLPWWSALPGSVELRHAPWGSSLLPVLGCGRLKDTLSAAGSSVLGTWPPSLLTKLRGVMAVLLTCLPSFVSGITLQCEQRLDIHRLFLGNGKRIWESKREVYTMWRAGGRSFTTSDLVNYRQRMILLNLLQSLARQGVDIGTDADGRVSHTERHKSGVKGSQVTELTCGCHCSGCAGKWTWQPQAPPTEPHQH